MDEIFFLVEESPEGGYSAQALGKSIFTQGDDLEATRRNIRDAVACHFGDTVPRIIRLHVVHEEILPMEDLFIDQSKDGFAQRLFG